MQPIDIFYLPGPQQQTHHTLLQQANGTARQYVKVLDRSSGVVMTLSKPFSYRSMLLGTS